MAEMAMQVVLSPLLGVIFDKLSTPLLKQFSLTCGVNDEIEKLSSALTSIRAVLQDAEEMQISEAAIIDWLRKLKDAAYEADDIIDECATEALIVPGSRDYLQEGLSFSKHLKLRRKIAKRIRKVTARVDNIAIERNNFHFRERVPESSVGEFMRQRETSSVVCEPVVYGRDEDKEKMVNILLSNANSENNLQVYPIVGMGGLGKTTLAQVIYNEETIAETFNTRIWICVSEDFSVKRLIKMMITYLSTEECKHEDLDPLQKRLKELLSGKKFLLVLDDVWNENQDLWEKFRCSINCGANGSSIIVTTRLPIVATIMGTHNRYDLKPLTDEFCWALFKARAFGMESENGSLEAIGRQIVEKCRGVPLVAKSLGGTLRFERDEIEWNSVRDSEIWEQEQGKNDILPSLRLSYNHLPSDMRQCFAYCSIYPKDYEIKVEELIQLWMANEFLQSNGRVELEDIGNHMFNQLVLRSFLQDVESDAQGKVKCKMHDLMHDLACSVAQNECYAFVSGGNNINTIPKTIHHLLIYDVYSFHTNIFLLSKSHRLLRTFLFLRLYNSEIKIVVKNFTCLRALKAFSVPNLPRTIGKLKHLRYLDLSRYDSNKLAKSICCLKNLQTLKLSESHDLQKLPKPMNKLINLRHLDLSWCWSLIKLPEGIGELTNLRHLDLTLCVRLIKLPDEIRKLISLRHLDLSYCKSLIKLPDGIGKLINLRHLELRGCDALIKLPDGFGKLINLKTLGMFVVGTRESGHSIKELHDLNQLQGSLEIVGLENVRDGEEGKQANLTAKKNLSSLTLRRGDRYGKRGNSISNNTSEEDVLEALQPPLNLSGSLCISGYGGSRFPSWINNLLSLAEIELRYCTKCEDLPPLGHLPLLKKLQIRGMDSLRRINKQFYGINSSQVIFPSLQFLRFDDMSNWEEWEDLEHKQVFPRLRELVLLSCHSLALLPSALLCSVQNFEVESCEKIRSLPTMPCLRVLRLGSSFYGRGFTKRLSVLKSLAQTLQHLSSLQTLVIANCSQLELSVGDFHHLLALKDLKLDGLPKLTSLPDLHHLSTLQTLTIKWCKNLMVLPQGMQNLTSLRSLTIQYCSSDLYLRCKKNEGEYWPYISHIPDLEISNYF